MINLKNINKVLICDECNSDFEIKYSDDKLNKILKCRNCDIQYKIIKDIIIFEKNRNKIKKLSITNIFILVVK